jgi:putative DNA primase/helicase
MSKLSAAEVESLGRKAWNSAPNESMSSRRKGELRFGAHGSKSLLLDTGDWFDHERNEGGGVAALRRMAHGHDPEPNGHDPAERLSFDIPPRMARSLGQPAAWWDYFNSEGKIVGRVVRFQPPGRAKEYRQCRPAADGWQWKMNGLRLPLYRLPDLLRAPAATVYLVEGEKVADALRGLGLLATTNPGGAGKFTALHAKTLTGRDVVLLPDNDEPGRRHRAKTCAALVQAGAQVRVVQLPGLPPKGDAVQWIEAGGTADKLAELVARTASTHGAHADPAPSETVEGGHDRDAPPVAPAATADDLADAGGFVTEDSVALAFARSYENDLRFDHHAGAWFQWTGSAWKKEETKLAFSWARHTARKLAKDSENAKTIGAAGKASFAAGVERFAQADRAFAVTSAIWDCDPWLLGTPGGTVDLKTGTLHPAKQSDHISKQTAIAPAHRANCPQWLAFLEQATQGDQAVVGFLRRWFGYTLTGITREHALLFVFGDGGNGKGVCMKTVAGIMGDYAVNAAMDSFTASKGDKHPADMAMLAGARMVLTTEVDEGQTWAEARLKSLTGGDLITARFMRRDFFTFQPAFKLTVSGNHKPALRNVDAAARRRFNLAPFVHKPLTPDKLLPEELKAEWPGILRWMLEGCLEWQRIGLQQPEAVKLATEEYFEAQDVIGKWMAERCILHATLEIKPGLLLADCRQWAAANGEEVPTPSQFRGAMERVRGIRYVTVNGIGWVKGVGLNVPPEGQGGGGWG